MATRIDWTTSAISSGLYAAEVLERDGRLADARLQSALTPAVARLREVLAGLPLERSRVTCCLAASGFSGAPTAAQLSECLRVLGCPADVTAPMLAELTEAIAALTDVQRTVLPDLQRDLVLRVGPLRQLWAERGPGMLRALGRLTSDRVVPSEARLVLVHPAAGGGGSVCPWRGAVVMEAVLANPVARLPETVRLAWLLASLQSAMNEVSGEPRNGASRSITEPLGETARLALVPAVLTAAEHLELLQYDQELLGTTLEAWRVASPERTGVAERLARWWSEFQQEPVDWDEAVVALKNRLNAM